MAAVVGVLIEVPVMLSVYSVCNRTRHWFPEAGVADPHQGHGGELCIAMNVRRQDGVEKLSGSATTAPLVFAATMPA